MSCGSPVPASDDRCPRCGTSRNSRADRLIGTILADKYRIEDCIGSGGMCDVYRARHVVIGKQVAIKVLKPEYASDPKIARRFYREVRAASRIRHPHAIDVTDFGIDRGNTPYIVMELVEGHTLSELIRQHGAFTVERTANILRQVCGALDAAHSVGVIHRDIKPDNILIADYEGQDWVEVLDFGVAKIQEDVNRRVALTGANFLIGTPRYMSPEQVEEKPVDARSDIYSLGVVLYEMLTGDSPFEGNSTRLLIAHASEPPPPLRQKRFDLPPQVEEVVLKALEKNPDRRQQSASELAEEFALAAGVLTPAEAEANRGGAFSRVSVPLSGQLDPAFEASEASQAAEPLLAAELDDETVVRKRDRSQPAPPPTSRAYYDASTLDEEDGVASDEADRREAERREARRREPAAARRAVAAAAVSDGGYKKSTLFISLLIAAIVLGFVAYLIFGDRSAPSDSTAGAQAGEPPQQSSASRPTAPAATSPSAAAAPSPNVAAQPEDGVDITPGPKSPPPAPEEEAAETERVAREAPAVDTGQVRQEVVGTLRGWASALASRNLNSHIDYYLPRLDRYYLRRGVSRGYVRADRARALSIYDTMQFNFDNIEVRVDPSGKTAVATFDKTWDFKGKRNSSGSVRERVWLRNVRGQWRIAAERDLMVHHMRLE